ncbi:MAG: FmdE family protein [Desulfovibrionaceae bacterium]
MLFNREEFERQLECAVQFHGHLCGGQVIGTRMAMAGLRELGIQDPKGKDRKDFVVIVETDRCATDAIIAVTGLTPGKRSIKVLDFGKMAATFVHLKTGKAVRIHALESSRERATRLAEKLEGGVGGKDAYLEALIDLPEDELVAIDEVSVTLDATDLPGPPASYKLCAACGETILDGREVELHGETYCKPCALPRFGAVVLDKWPGVAAPASAASRRTHEWGPGVPRLDWNAVWRDSHHAKARARHNNTNFWNKRAKEFTKAVTETDYVVQFLDILQPEARWSVLDMGCAAGTLAVPLASRVRAVTAVDPSERMRELLRERLDEQGRDNVRVVEGAWESPWEEFGIDRHDVVIGSRSLVVEDLRAAVLKAHACAREKVFLSALVDEGPHDSRIVQAVGRDFRLGMDYIVVLNLLRQLGIYASVAFTRNERDKPYADVAEAFDDLRWMVHDMTPEEAERLTEYLEKTLVPTDEGLRLPGRKPTRWAVLHWDTRLGCDPEAMAVGQ